MPRQRGSGWRWEVRETPSEDLSPKGRGGVCRAGTDVRPGSPEKENVRARAWTRLGSPAPEQAACAGVCGQSKAEASCQRRTPTVGFKQRLVFERPLQPSGRRRSQAAGAVSRRLVATAGRDEVGLRRGSGRTGAGGSDL